MFSRVVIAVLLAFIIGVPFLMRPPQSAGPKVGPQATVVIVTPHVPQIQYEFGLAFERWHLRKYGSPVHVDWRQPGGTSEIIKMLSAQYAARCGDVIERWQASEPQKLTSPSLDLSGEFPPGSIGFDLLLGGGSFDHGRLKDPGTGAYWYKPYEDAGVESVSVRCKGPIDAGVVQLERQVIAFVARGKQGAAEMLLRVPVSTFADGAKAIEELATASKQTSGDPPKPAPVAITVRLNLGDLERQVAVSISMPLGFSKAQLDEWYGENKLGAGTLYDPDQNWIGTAISGFGIVFNKDVLAKLNIPAPQAFEDLADPRLRGWIVFADPRQSGSVATTIDALLSFYGWDKGWRVLREMCANTRYYTNSAPRPPIDVSQGEAAAGLCIDFYGRNQSQAVLREGQDPATSRVGYIDPKGATYMDADPVSLLRGGPNPTLAKRFIEFSLSEEGQALWQFPAQTDAKSAGNPSLEGVAGIKMGPQRHELRRMPVRRIMYEKYMPHMIDQVNPFITASTTKPAGWRGTIGVMMGAFGIENADEQHAAWNAIIAARADPKFDKRRLAEMEDLFYAWPSTVMPDGKQLAFTPQNVRAITTAWKDASFKSRCEVRYFEFFKANYRRVTALGPPGKG